jgi:hypothetical protein
LNPDARRREKKEEEEEQLLLLFLSPFLIKISQSRDSSETGYDTGVAGDDTAHKTDAPSPAPSLSLGPYDVRPMAGERGQGGVKGMNGQYANVIGRRRMLR